MLKPLISIIVPVYNTSFYLRTCLDSIISQSYTFIEIIVIDDGSTDNSGKICDEYAEKDNRIKVFHRENGGVSRAKNYGLKIAKGEYVCFVDSDDYILQNHIIDFVDKLSKEIDIYIQGLCFKKEDDSEEQLIYPCNGVVNIKTAIEDNKICSHAYTGGKLYKRSFILNYGLKFPEKIKFSEDLIFFLEALTHVNKVCFIENASYQYLLHNGSASGRFYSLDTEWLCLQTFKTLLLKISEQTGYDLLETRCCGEIYTMLFARVRNVLYSKYNRSERLQKLSQLSSDDLTRLKKHQYINNVFVRCANLFLQRKTLKIYDFVLKVIYKFKQI